MPVLWVFAILHDIGKNLIRENNCNYIYIYIYIAFTAKIRKLQMMQNHEQIIQQANCDTQADDFNF
jgi:hypothetical protein